MPADKTLNITEAHLDIALNQLKVGFWELDIASLAMTCTPQCKANVGAALNEELSYARLIDLIIPEDRAKMQANVQTALNSDSGKYFSQYRVRHKNGNVHWVEANGTVLFQNGVPIKVIGTTIDITDKKDLELVKDELLSVATHELKTPVSAVKGYLQILHRYIESKNENKFVAISTRALGSTERITRLLADIANPAQRQVNQMILVKEPFDLRELAEEIIANTMLIHPDYTIDVMHSEDQFRVSADRYRIGQVLTNLLNNAIKYSGNKKNIEVNITTFEGMFKVMVTDFGVGLKEEEHLKVFQKFYRADSAPKDVDGFGIGLFLCSEIIIRHGGKIGVEKTLNLTGTSFYFSLPK